ncbi:hypothetical protein JK358_25205 [Nocardia sp. 2]|uniref:DUF3558 domain-containing protein n=1 Tax=Nocardia acididurans TaxID=2802282 RepID=A0ABS1MBT2_9NOCA|nr:hypothetical protein [Nocardia acididurans]MBL1077704.1 hypothetical protein [Nocardia acididurans]
MTRRSRLFLLVGALVVDTLLVVGAFGYRAVTTPIAGRANPVVAQVGLGVIATVDPCGFVTSDVVGGPGIVVRGVRPLALRSCFALVGRPDQAGRGVVLDVEVIDGFDLDRYRDNGLTVRDQGAVHRAIGAEIPSRASGVGDVMIDIVYHDNGDAVVTRASWTGPAPDPGAEIDQRAVAARVGDAAAHAMATGAFRHLTYPADSAAAVDLCSRLTASTLDPGLDIPGTRSARLSRNDCRWTVRSGEIHRSVEIRVRLDLQRNQGVFPNRPNTTVDGRPTQVWILDNVPYASEAAKSCLYATNAKVWNPWPGYRIVPDTPEHPDPSLVEVVEVSVAWAPDEDERRVCESAARIAWELWPSIP